LYRKLSELFEELLFVEPDGTVVGSGKKLWELYPFPEAIAALEEARERGRSSFQAEERGRSFTFQLARLPDGTVAVLKRDDTLAKEFDSVKREVVSTLSHEIKTPLTVIRGNVEFLLHYGNCNDKEVLKETLEKVEKLERIVSGIGRLFKKSSQMAALNLRPLTEEVVESFTPKAAEKGITLKTELEDTNTVADAVLFQQLLRNLLDNAVKFTKEGEVRVKLTEEFLEVSDTGRGIPREKLSRVFERYYREGENSGQGIGLSVVREIAKHHGWKVEVESEVGRGSRFRVVFYPDENIGKEAVKE
jgi:two-component system phosphate regulon sensor histidine kinase PhoR